MEITIKIPTKPYDITIFPISILYYPLLSYILGLKSMSIMNQHFPSIFHPFSIPHPVPVLADQGIDLLQALHGSRMRIRREEIGAARFGAHQVDLATVRVSFHGIRVGVRWNLNGT